MEESRDSAESSNESIDSESSPDSNSLEARVNEESSGRRDNSTEHESGAAKSDKNYSANSNKPKYKNLRISSKSETEKHCQDKSNKPLANYNNSRYKNLKLISSKSDAQEHTIERTNDGAVALIYYEDQATGKVEFLFEQRP